MARPILVLDPGHGGRARVGGSSPNNATGPNRLLERDLTLDLAMRLRMLLAKDFDVRLTRDTDTNLSLSDRAAVARQAAADSFISIHFNGDGDAAVNGTEAWIAKAGRAERELLGQSLVDHVAHVAQIRNRGVKRRDLGVLKADRHAPNTAACLLEVSFLTNGREATQLAQESYKRALADAIATGVRGYFSGASLPPPAVSHAAASGTGSEHVHCPPLKQHASGDNLALRWTGASASMSSIDLVVHLHGFIGKGVPLKLARKEPISGVELAARTRPTLGLVPLGWKTGMVSQDGASDVVDFPALLRANGDGLKDVMRWSLDWFAAEQLGGQLPGSLGIERLILTAHSGGGARLQKLLARHDPHELHLFDCLYEPAVAIQTWAAKRLHRDAAALAGLASDEERTRYMEQHGGALCCVWVGTGAHSRPLGEFVQREIGKVPDERVRKLLARYYRVVQTKVGHNDIPRPYGALLLESAAADTARVAKSMALASEGAKPQLPPPPTAEEIGQKRLLNETKTHADPKETPIDLPGPGSGTDAFDAEIPDGLRFSHWDLELLDASPLANAKLEHAPARDATGKVKIKVAWSHPPYGKVRYRLRAWASRDGRATPVRILHDSEKIEERTLSLMRQDVPLQFAVRGEKAKQLHSAIKMAQKKGDGADSKAAALETLDPHAEAHEPTTILIISIALIAAVLAAIGLFVLYQVLMEAMKRGYDVRDTKFKSGFGEGATKHEQELVFNLTKPVRGRAASFADEAVPFIAAPRSSLALALPPGLADWASLVSFRPPAVLQKSIRKRVSGVPTWAGWPIQAIETKANGPVNLDYYPVHVRRLPTVGGKQFSAEELLEHIRSNINSFVDPRYSNFEPYDSDEAKLWTSGSPEGALIHIDMRMGSTVANPDDGTVACTEHTPSGWLFSTVWTPADLWHPVSGNRRFGFTKREDDTHVFFTRGADRVSGILDRVMSGTVFSGAHALWMSFQQGVAKFVNDHGGDASIGTAISDRHDWPAVKAAHHKPARTWQPVI